MDSSEMTTKKCNTKSEEEKKLVIPLKLVIESFPFTQFKIQITEFAKSRKCKKSKDTI